MGPRGVVGRAHKKKGRPKRPCQCPQYSWGITFFTKLGQLVHTQRVCQIMLTTLCQIRLKVTARQLSGTGGMTSNWNTMPATNWGSFNPLQTYGKDTPVKNCASGVCIDGYLWYNAYIPANLINRTNSAGACTGVCGIASSYKPISSPVFPTP